MKRPSEQDYPLYYKGYIESVAGEDVISVLEQQLKEADTFFNSISASKENFAYAEGKWTVKEVIGHMVDVERVMAYRALAFARNEKKRIPGFDENDYVRAGGFYERSVQSLVDEFKSLRLSNIILFKSFNDEVLSRRGIANEFEITVTAIIFIIAGHYKHHVNILMERYLK